MGNNREGRNEQDRESARDAKQDYSEYWRTRAPLIDTNTRQYYRRD
jgi:hypothetical protein